MKRIWWLPIGALSLSLCAAPLLRAHNEKPAESKPDLHEETGVRLSEDQIKAGDFGIREVGGGILTRQLSVPGSIVPAGDRIAKVSVRLLGIVAELRKQLGDQVEVGDVLAIIESREIADAKSEYLATRLTFDLQQTLFNRSRTLFESKVTSENDFLRARTNFLDVQNKFEVARQKLFALGLTEEQLAALPNQPVATLRRQELRAPIAGRIAERRVDLGSLVGREGQESELFVIVDASVVWADLAVSPVDLPAIHEGQDINITTDSSTFLSARVKFVSPMLDKDTRFARVIASVENADGSLRPGSFVTAAIRYEPISVPLAVPKSALQKIKNEPVVFARNGGGFEPRSVVIGREDRYNAEILSGLARGDKIATTNTFILKADLGKGEAEHAD
ncbi:MAG: efflux RND transporter periplasmic adaptor subunit [Xanthobacteraceae bacterium]|nr:efflux RND transporter periplasmic adaptor subunit [Xanthobacteraceae bacterium]